MNVHYLQHVAFEGLGSIEAWVRRGGHTLGATHFYRGDPLPAVDAMDLLVVMGGPMNIYEEADYPWLADEKRFIERAIAAGRRVLGICLGAQLVADVLGARVYANAEKEIGWFQVEKTESAAASRLFAAFPAQLDVFHWHGDTFDIPAGAVRVARSAGCANQAFVYDKRVVGLQFHLETTSDSARQITHTVPTISLTAATSRRRRRCSWTGAGSTPSIASCTTCSTGWWQTARTESYQRAEKPNEPRLSRRGA